MLALVLLLLLPRTAAGLVGTQQLPAGWAGPMAAGSMLHHRPASGPLLDARLRPSIGNGRLATLAGSANVYLAGVFNLHGGAYEPFRARLPGLAAMYPAINATGSSAHTCGAQPPAQRTRCGTPPYAPANGCTAAQGCCYAPFPPVGAEEARGLPWCHAMVNSSGCPSKCHVQVAAPPAAAAGSWASDEALDLARAAFLQVQTVALSADCSITLEQRTYAHRSRLALLVTDFVATTSASCAATGHVVQLAAGLRASVANASQQDFAWQKQGQMAGGQHGEAAAAVYVGTTLAAEKQGRKITAAFATRAPLSGTLSLSTTPGQQRTVFSFPTAFTSDVDALSDASTLAANATAELHAALAMGADALFAEHVATVTDENARIGISVEGNLPLARVINVTMYSLRASLSADAEWATAPGGLSTGGRWTADGHDTRGGAGYPEGQSSYYGHVFWDSDVWMLPAMLPQHPAIARSMLGYRFRTMGAAVANAKAEGHNGTKWAWESAFSGVTATGGDCQEIHLQAGIAMALRAHFRQTHDMLWLKTTAWPMLANIVAFFESRATIGGTRCPAGHDCISLNGVQSPNEYASGIDNDIYTNTAFASVLQWVTVCATLLGEANAGRYAALAQRIVIPFNNSLGRHEEYTRAPAALRIKQATMTMVPYPVEYPMSEQVQRNDLLYEAAHIGSEGPAMTHSMLVIDWLQMRNKTAGDAEFAASYDTNLVGPFLQWMECPLPPDFCQGHRPATNFLTAAGGFMQAVLYGYLGSRYNDANLTLLARTLPLNASHVHVRGLSYRGADLTVEWDGTAASVTCARGGCDAPALCATGGAAVPQPLLHGATVRFAADTVVAVAPCAIPEAAADHGQEGVASDELKSDDDAAVKRQSLAKRTTSSVALQLFPCDAENPRQRWTLSAGQTEQHQQRGAGVDLQVLLESSDPESAGSCATSGGGGGTQNGGSPILLGPCGSRPWQALLSPNKELTLSPVGGPDVAATGDEYARPAIVVAPYGALPGAPVYELSTAQGSGAAPTRTWLHSNTSGLLQLRSNTTLCLDAGTPFNLSCASSSIASKPYCDASLPAVSRATDLVQRMTLHEKVLALTVMDRRSNGVPRLGMPSMQYGEALHGVCAKICGQSTPLGDGTSSTGCATSFPHALHTASSFNRSLFSAVGTVIGVEARSLANQQGTDAPLHAFAPNVQVGMDPRWGRLQEVAGEDVLVAAEYAVAMINGMQGHGNEYQMMSMSKHYIDYTLEGCTPEENNCRTPQKLFYPDRHRFDANVTARDQVEFFLPSWRAAITRAKVGGLMCSCESHFPHANCKC